MDGIFIILLLVLFSSFIYYMQKTHEKKVREAYDQRDSVMLIGLPEAGKSVYFCVAMDLLQRKCNDMQDGFSVIFEDHKTERHVRNTVDVLLRNQKWPPNTPVRETHNVSISIKGKKTPLTYKDFSGESFMRAFGNITSPNIASTESAEDTTQEDQLTNELTKDIVSAKGIILVLDSSLIMDTVNLELSACLFNVLTLIKHSNFTGKLAIVFTKADLIRDIVGFLPEEAFKSQQPNSYARLREIDGYRLFLVSAVRCIVNNDGVSVPPLGYTSSSGSENVLAPLCWLLGVEEDMFQDPND